MVADLKLPPLQGGGRGYMKSIYIQQMKLALVLVLVGLTGCSETKMVAAMARESSTAKPERVEKLEVVKMAESPELLPTNDYSYQPSFVDDRAGSYCERYVASGFGDVAYIILAGLAYAAASSYGGGYSANSDDCYN